MIYLIAALAIVFVAAWCFLLDGLLARAMYRGFWAFGLSHDRADFIRGFRIYVRSVGVAMITLIFVGVALR
jgi:ABC-type uncharacterized transport system permease subunit